MDIRYSIKFSNDVIDDLILKLVRLYMVAREKSGNNNYADRHKVIKAYIDNYYADDYTQYIIDLASSNDMNDTKELVAIQDCEDILPLVFWKNFKKTFFVKRKYYEERFKYHFDKITRIIKKEIE